MLLEILSNDENIKYQPGYKSSLKEAYSTWTHVPLMNVQDIVPVHRLLYSSLIAEVKSPSFPIAEVMDWRGW